MQRHSLTLGLSLLLFAGTLSSLKAADDYILGPDSQPQNGVPVGKVTQYTWDKSEVYAGTTRDYWVYVPHQYKADGPPACVMVFQDGNNYQRPNGQFRAPIVFDNLIHKGEMPVTIGIFIDPGTFINTEKPQWARSNRSFEYDTLSDQYVKFVEQEILAEVGKNLKLRKDAAGCAICGISSGGICAFTAAWERPDLFSKVISHVGSFTNIRGGDAYPGIIRKTERKPIKIFLQDGLNDLNNLHGNWPLSNLSMASALKFMEYDYKLIIGDGSHNGKQGGASLPNALRWIWKDEVPKKKVSQP